MQALELLNQEAVGRRAGGGLPIQAAVIDVNGCAASREVVVRHLGGEKRKVDCFAYFHLHAANLVAAATANKHAHMAIDKGVVDGAMSRQLVVKVNGW
jgi:hypothetical protein